MLTMQYSFTLPADYDMSIIERRIRDKGPAFDGLPGLAFKAFMVARKDDDAFRSADNLYAPLYLWRSIQGMKDFLSDDRFRAVAQAFGWPVVRTWIPVAVTGDPDPGATRFVSRELVQLSPYTDLEDLGRSETDALCENARQGLIYGLSAFDPATWTRVRFRLWSQPPRVSGEIDAQTYRVLHVSPGA
jgi:hypothetical protein